MITRRRLLELTGAATALAGSDLGSSLTSVAQTQTQALTMPPVLPEGTRGEAFLETLPGKKPLIKLSYRPPNYETPLSYLGTPITPNEGAPRWRRRQ
jgi:sulfite dehydrogenase (cytochrome) subunit A